MAERLGPIERINRCLRTYLPEGDYGPRVHRDFIADAFAAGMRAAVHVDVLDEDVADAFEDYCEEAFTE